MSLSRKIIIGFLSFMFVIYLGVAIVSNEYLWFSIITIITIGLFFLEDYLYMKFKNFKFLRFFPLLFLGMFIYATISSYTYISSNPQSVTLYTDEDTGFDRVLIEYGIYGFINFDEMDLYANNVHLNTSSSGPVLAEPLDPDLEFFVWIYSVFAVPFYLSLVISILNETRSSSVHTTRRESFMKVILTSGDRYSSKNPRTSHVQINESFIQEKAKSDMIKDE